MSKELISITKKSKIKYLRGAFKIGRDTWKVGIIQNSYGSYVIVPKHRWQCFEIEGYRLDNQTVCPGYMTVVISPDFWFFEHCEQWIKHRDVLNYNKDVRAALKKLD